MLQQDHHELGPTFLGQVHGKFQGLGFRGVGVWGLRTESRMESLTDSDMESATCSI